MLAGTQHRRGKDFCAQPSKDAVHGANPSPGQLAQPADMGSFDSVAARSAAMFGCTA
jgi:hypothetical protein